MTCCSHCRDAGKFFNRRTAEKDLNRYKRKGPNRSTRLLIDELRKKNLSGRTLLDIGGGIGAISFELLEHGIERSVHVDASPAYLHVMESEMELRGVKNKIDQIFGDFTVVSGSVGPADVVILDRVICCYPDMKKLVNRSSNKAMHYYGVVYPRSWRITKFVMNLQNLWLNIQRIEFRTYLHPPTKIDAQIQKNGFKKIFHEKTIIWDVVLYEKIA